MRRLAAILMLALSSLAAAQQIPPGTVLPVMLNSTLDARRSPAGLKIDGAIMQDVPLPDGSKLPRGSKVVGHVVSSEPLAPGSPSRIAIAFDTLRIDGREVPIAAHLRALASELQVFEAKLPTNAIDDYGTSTSDWNTVQIGGAGVYRGNGEVVQGGSVVGHTTHYGAVSAKLIADPQAGCAGDEQREQALWLFSPWACGVYGYSDLKITKRGNTDPPGVIEFESSGNVRINGGSGWLLRTNGSY